MTSWASLIASIISSSEASLISPSTMQMSFSDAATMRSRVADLSCEVGGLTMYSPLILATRTSEMGPLKGISVIIKADEAAKAANASGKTSASAEIRNTFTWVSA